MNGGYLGSVSDGLDSSCSSLLSDSDIEYNASSPDEKALGGFIRDGKALGGLLRDGKALGGLL